jgi:hypothetical protein
MPEPTRGSGAVLSPRPAPTGAGLCTPFKERSIRRVPSSALQLSLLPPRIRDALENARMLAEELMVSRPTIRLTG